jgi:hypothetical protein
MLTFRRLAGGLPMVVIGLVYLAFEGIILAEFKSTTARSSPKDRNITRSLTGIQVCSHLWPRQYGLTETGRPDFACNARNSVKCSLTPGEARTSSW